MEKIIIRQNNMFCIDKTKLTEAAKKEDICQALYAAIYTEFFGAKDKLEYKDLTNLQKLGAMNQFAIDWLTQRGLK